MLIDFKQQEDLDDFGFNIINLCSEQEISWLHELYIQQFVGENVNGLFASHNQFLFEKNRLINNKIKEILEIPIQNKFKNVEFVIGHFMIKAANTKSVFNLHQDWNLVDENQFKSFQLWIPLQLTTPKNGGLFVLPRSHKFYNHHRSGSIGIPVVPANQEKIKPNLIEMNIEEGNAALYYNNTFHGSFSNDSENDRVVVLVNLKTKDAPMYYFNAENESIVKYLITSDNLMSDLPQLEKGNINSLKPSNLVKEALPSYKMSDISGADLFNKIEESIKEPILLNSICKEQGVQREIYKNGFTTINLLPENVVKELYTLFMELYDLEELASLPTRYTSIEYPPKKSSSGKVSLQINTICKPYLDEQFKNYLIAVSIFYNKQKSEFNDIEMHRDPSLLLNEHICPHYAIWIPLQDVTVSSGCLKVVPKSNNGTVLNAPQRELYDQNKRAQFEKEAIHIPLQKGQAIIFDNRLVHSSNINTSMDNRLGVVFRITDNKSNYFSFNFDNMTSCLKVLSQQKDFYYNPNWKNLLKPTELNTIGSIENYSKI